MIIFLDTSFLTLRNIVARPNGQPGGRRNPFICNANGINEKENQRILNTPQTTVIALGTSVSWVPGAATAFRHMQSSIGNKRVESCCNNEAMRLGLYNA